MHRPFRSVHTSALGAIGIALLLLASVFVVPIPAPGTGTTRTLSSPSKGTDRPSATLVAESSPHPSIKIRPPPQPTWLASPGTPNASRPPALGGGSAAYDPIDNETVYFGGCFDFACTELSNQTWVFTNGTWSNETDSSDAPPARQSAMMDYDANMQAVLLFGGAGVTSYFNDTWLFRAGTWTNVTDLGPAPPARYGAGMTFDPQPEENGSVLFGGYGYSGYFSDTWIYEGGAGWVPLSTNSLSPPQVALMAMAYDASDGYVVLFGGYLASSGYGEETWELYSGQWWEVHPASPPSARDYLEMTYVPSLAGDLLVGGYSGSAALNDTWIFSKGVWTQQAPSTPPPDVDSAALALDGTGTTAILIGGSNLTENLPGAWAYEFAPTVGIGLNETTLEVGESVTVDALADAGTAPYHAVFEFGDGSSAFAFEPGPTIALVHTYDQIGTFGVSISITDAVGVPADTGSPLPVTVTEGPSISVKAVPSTGEVGFPVSFDSSLLAPGTPPLLYAWAFGDGGSASSGNASHTYTTPGTYPVDLLVTDHNHANASASLIVTIVAGPTLSAAVSPTDPTAGAMANFTANVSGGTAPFAFSWQFGDGSPDSAFPAPQHAYASAGSYTVKVSVTDALGGRSNATLTIPVVAASTAPTTTGSPSSSVPLWFWGGVVVLVAALVVGSALLARRDRPPAP